MPNTSQLTKFLKADHVKDGDIITFIDAGKIVPKTFERDGIKENKDLLEINVEFNGDTKIYSPNGTSIGLLSQAWGPDTERWINKRARLVVVPTGTGKNMIIAKPVEGVNI